MIDFPNTELPVGIRGGSDLLDENSGQIILKDYFPETSTPVTVIVGATTDVSTSSVSIASKSTVS